MKTITCRNDAGLEAVFTYDHDSCEYFLVSCDGIYSVKNAVSTSQNATTDGTTYNGEGLEQRNIVITANIREITDRIANFFQGFSKFIQKGRSFMKRTATDVKSNTELKT